jgi:hypothetical protein
MAILGIIARWRVQVVLHVLGNLVLGYLAILLGGTLAIRLGGAS